MLRSVWLLLLLLIMIVAGNVEVRDNPTAIVPPMNMSDPGYVLAESQGGLANRLRVLAAYMHVGKARFDGAHLVFIWDVNSACPGHFLEIFSPIKDVIFARNESRYVLDKHAKIVYENSMAVFHWTMQMNDIPKNRFGYPTWAQIEYNSYAQFIPLPRIVEKVDAFVARRNICNCTSMHIRMTDLNALMPPRKRISLNGFFSFVEYQDSPVFLMTDDPKTQKLFLDKYGSEKILVYDRVGTEEDIQRSETTEPIRYTTLEHTVLEEYLMKKKTIHTIYIQFILSYDT